MNGQAAASLSDAVTYAAAPVTYQGAHVTYL
jgi:hypothetical protein